jgi:hypothetical protein
MNAREFKLFAIRFKFLFVKIFTHLVELKWLIMIVFSTSISKWVSTIKHLRQITFEISFVTIVSSQYCCQWRDFLSKSQHIFCLCLTNFFFVVVRSLDRLSSCHKFFMFFCVINMTFYCLIQNSSLRRNWDFYILILVCLRSSDCIRIFRFRILALFLLYKL